MNILINHNILSTFSACFQRHFSTRMRDVMSSNKAGDTALRLLSLWQLLPEKGNGDDVAGLIAKLSAVGFEVKTRTVQRDLNALAQRNLALSIQDGRKLLWYRREPPKPMTQAEALTLILFEPMLAVMPNKMKLGLLDKSADARALLAKAKVPYSNKIACYMGDNVYQSPEVDDSLLSVIQEALLADHCIEASYQATQKTEAKTYQLTPLALVLRGRVLYLVASEVNQERSEPNRAISRESRRVPSKPKLFAIHRFKQVEHSFERFQRPGSFSLSEYLDSGAMQFSDGGRICLEANIQPQLQFYLNETPLSDDQTLTPLDDGRWLLTATVFDGWQLKWWLKGQGANIEIISPEPLRELMIASLEKSLMAYKKSTS
ncbi:MULTISPECIES: helix-turn-helix transcriptional regulator [Shewanella]|uniref:helix-turn-helix transcriptional regulator n=1 Tax=Shewanella TaxID=22 RepID=UPI001AAFB702|nr:WYL domain-containing protein [Shewanella algae]MBO2546199.1 WYL domain-containing protein [Shewanella algae]